MNYFSAPGLLHKIRHKKFVKIKPIEYVSATIYQYLEADEKLVKKKGRKREFVIIRQLVMYFVYKYCNVSLQQAGDIFGKGHDTVIYGNAQVANAYDTDEIYRANYHEIERRILM